jgi:hypothetical protein
MSQTLQRQTNQMSVRLVFWGVAIGVIGAMLRKHAENVGEFVGILGSRATTSDLVTAAPADWGMGLLIIGAVVTLAGLVGMTARRPT